MNIQKSYLNDESQLSIFFIPPKNESDLKYQQLLKQSSQYRTNIRQLTHDNQWLRTTNEGLQNQCTILKQLLQEQKQLIGECNSDLRMANEEINRLEDCLHGRNLQLERLENIIEKKDGDIQSKYRIITELESEIEVLRGKLQRIQKLYEQKQISHMGKEQQFSEYMIEKVQGVINQLTLKLSFNNANSSTTQIQLKQLIGKLEYFLQYPYQQQNQIKKQNDKNMIQILQLQLNEVSDLAEEFQNITNKNNSTIKQLSDKLQCTNKIVETNLQHCNLHRYCIEKLIELLGLLLKDANAELTTSKLTQFLLNGKRKFEIDLIIAELRPIINDRNEEKCRVSHLTKEWESKFEVAQQQYSTLQLKHATLRRQFEAVMDDNKRIIKAQQFTRFRAERNGYPSYRGKENNFNFSNTVESICKK